MSDSLAHPVYRGRFAPSPTGPLHIGSLIAAVGSYLQAKTQSGFWFLRIEDLDPPREAPGASDSIITTLADFGFEWDGEILFQSRRHALYESVIDQLQTQDRVYYCSCSRKQINEIAKPGLNGPIYPQSCYGKKQKKGALRFHTDKQTIVFKDSVQGMIKQNIATESGDFVIKRSDGLYNYQLAVVIDDFEQQITEVVRGSDLLSLTPSQIYLQQALNYTTPDYIHMPVITNTKGQKLSKQTNAPAVTPIAASESLWFCLNFLGQQPPDELKKVSKEELWRWAMANWSLEKIPKTLSIAINPGKTDD